MSRKYTKINQYEKEILQWKNEGITNREIARRLGLEYSQIHNWVSRYNERQRKLKAGITPRKKGRPRKDAAPQQEVSNKTNVQDASSFPKRLLQVRQTDAAACKGSGTCRKNTEKAEIQQENIWIPKDQTLAGQRRNRQKSQDDFKDHAQI